MYAGFCCLLSVPGVIRCIFEYRQLCISKMIGRREKRGKIWGPWGISNTHMGTFDILGFKVTLG